LESIPVFAVSLCIAHIIRRKRNEKLTHKDVITCLKVTLILVVAVILLIEALVYIIFYPNSTLFYPFREFNFYYDY